jgi:hypothetical protein
VMILGHPASKVNFLVSPLKDLIYGFGSGFGSTVILMSVCDSYAPLKRNMMS